jgi:MOSC domain-containing protein YiiM
LARRWKLDELPNQIIENNRSGWYCRVLCLGKVKAGDQISLLEKGSEWTVAEVAYMIRHVGDDFDRAERLYQCETLSAFIRNFIRKAIDDHDPRKQPKKPTSFFSFFRRS